VLAVPLFTSSTERFLVGYPAEILWIMVKALVLYRSQELGNNSLGVVLVGEKLEY
jgi:hypothetical protein